jgi:hypothetical protein
MGPGLRRDDGLEVCGTIFCHRLFEIEIESWCRLRGGCIPSHDLTFRSITICLAQLATSPRYAPLRLIFPHENKIYFTLKFSPPLSF